MTNQGAGLERMSETLGELKGQLGEVIQTVNRMALKVDALTERVSASAETPARIVALELRVTALETDRNRRDGATGVVAAIMKSPAAAWLALLAAGAWAVITGKVHG